MTVAKYPVDIGDDEGIVDAVNYLLSGPAGLGQNFEGFSAYLPAYLRPSSRQPWSLPIDTTLDPNIYLARPINNITIVGGNPSAYLLVTFTTPYTDPPFQFGDKLDIMGVTETGTDEPLNANSYVVFSCTNADVTIGYNGDFQPFTWNTYVSGGTIGRDYLNYILDTDCNARITVTGPTQQVFVSGQLLLEFDYDCTTATDLTIEITIRRFRAFPNNTIGDTDYIFGDPVIISRQSSILPITVTGVGSGGFEGIFTTVLDGPNLDFGYYWYILGVQFLVDPTSYPVYPVTIGNATLQLRSLTAQVIKQ